MLQPVYHFVTDTHASNHMSVWLYFACWNLKNNWNDINGNKMGTTCDRNHFVSSLWVKQIKSEEWEDEGAHSTGIWAEIWTDGVCHAIFLFWSKNVPVPHSSFGNKHNMWVWVTNSMTVVGGYTYVSGVVTVWNTIQCIIVWFTVLCEHIKMYPELLWWVKRHKAACARAPMPLCVYLPYNFNDVYIVSICKETFLMNLTMAIGGTELWYECTLLMNRDCGDANVESNFVNNLEQMNNWKQAEWHSTYSCTKLREVTLGSRRSGVASQSHTWIILGMREQISVTVGAAHCECNTSGRAVHIPYSWGLVKR